MFRDVPQNELHVAVLAQQVLRHFPLELRLVVYACGPHFFLCVPAFEVDDDQRKQCSHTFCDYP